MLRVVHVGVYGDVQRVKILYNKKDSALIQMAEPHQAHLGNFSLIIYVVSKIIKLLKIKNYDVYKLKMKRTRNVVTNISFFGEYFNDWYNFLKTKIYKIWDYTKMEAVRNVLIICSKSQHWHTWTNCEYLASRSR